MGKTTSRQKRRRRKLKPPDHPAVELFLAEFREQDVRDHDHRQRPEKRERQLFKSEQPVEEEIGEGERYQHHPDRGDH